jgi:type IV secretion system protein VirB10
MLIGIIVAVICLILGVTAWSLRSNLRLADVRPELHNVQHVPRVEGLERLPPDYSKIPTPKVAEPAEPAVPILGRPVPGDLGEAMVRAENRATASGDSTRDAARMERAAREREIEDAAKAPLFFTSSSRKGTSAATAPPPPSFAESPEPRTEQSRSAKAAVQSQPPNNAGSRGSSVSSYRVETAASPYQVMAGTVISAALITGISSDLPGTILATVTEPVYDTKLGRHLLIPQGTRLIGEYDSQVAFGQRRVLLIWNRLVFPDASSLTLDRLPGVDTAGSAGLEDGVDRHWQQLLAGAALSTLIGVAAELAAPDRNNGRSQVIVAGQQSIQDSINQVGQELTRRNLNVQPTLTVRPGYPVRVIVNKDLVVRPYQPLFVQRSP